MSLNIPQLDTPILFLVFNRLETTQRVFEKIKSVKPRFLYIASDGARVNKNNESFVVSEVRSWLLENIDWNCEVKTLFREVNLGCGLAVSSAIDWFFKNEEMGIIIEDDCLVDESFFWFAEELLIKYQDNYTITSICSSNTIEYSGNNNESYFFSKYSLIWGWATWRRAWDNYDLSISSWPKLKETRWLNSVDKSYMFQFYWTHVFDTCYNKEVNTWDFQWNFSSFLNGGLSIIPNVNLVRNIGIGVNQTHKVDSHYSTFVENKISFPLIHPKVSELNQFSDELLKKKIFSFSFLECIYVFIRKNILVKSFLKYAKNKIK
jgi:hypothetical protein